MKTSGMPWRYTLLTLKLDLFWLPGALWALFALIAWLLNDDGRAADIAVAFLGFALPLVAGVLASSAILDNPALELHLAAPRPAWRVLLERQGLILGLVAVAAITFQLYLVALSADMSRLGPLAARQLAWLIPTLVLMALGCASAFAFAQSMGGALLVGLIWILQVIARNWFMYYDLPRHLYVFMSASQPQHPDLHANQGVMLGLTVALFVASWALFKKQERYL